MSAKRKTHARDSKGRPAPRLVLRRGPKYTREERIAAVTIMLSLGGMTVESINAVRLRLNSNISTTSLARWLSEYGDEVKAAKADIIPKPTSTIELVQSAQANLVNDLVDIQNMIVTSIKSHPEQVDEASLRDKTVSLGITSDKIERWLPMTPEARDRWSQLQQMCLHYNLDPIAVFDDMLLGLQRAVEARQIASGHDI